ncbi:MULTISPECIES: DUF3027 domain-containing protein [Paenarthrobacter]|uniref:DUF3027 domain-containing protein n=1 Tax=Paenarthrobacter TaxID=1742992 RepID=UPI00074D34E6|nr:MULTISPECIES: DUF3027 domain-containing protein [Paenarthrobacter]AMB39541.1 hypothetical protein AUT26_04445 [Arthrobacter sp. ATCC 21022]KUR65217.1 hypothetical protein JM67_05035 [Arthrobacter sp. ATCC 21022]QSZ55016.1 hypothetical protein AYX19_19900 [Paenarthrobacter ureafaciens]RWW95776.1 DUF3027 domain-containing protein [Paenarthrobacter ureafaciens]WOC61931.1 DUF3027 domain-containing protein [Paenarthrobacter sp. AT5]
MTSESAQDTQAAGNASHAASAAEAPANGETPASGAGPAAKEVPARKGAAPKPRAGVPVWRTGKPDAFLAAAVHVARTAVEGIAKPGEVGAHIGAKSEGDRVVTHLFESKLPGYGGWQWYAVVTRNSRSKIVTVSELGLLPSEDSILAPEWVPWAKRVRPEDETPLVEETAGEVPEEAVQAEEAEAEASRNEPAEDADDADADAEDAVQEPADSPEA